MHKIVKSMLEASSKCQSKLFSTSKGKIKLHRMPSQIVVRSWDQKHDTPSGLTSAESEWRAKPLVMDEGALEFRRDECDRESNRTKYTI